MGRPERIELPKVRPFGDEWALLTEHANELFSARRHDDARQPYAQALSRAKTQFEQALVGGGLAADAVSMLIVSASNAARNHVMRNDQEAAFRLLTVAAQALLEGLDSTLAPFAVKREIARNLPRMMSELHARKLPRAEYTQRARHLQDRLELAVLEMQRQAREGGTFA